MGRDLVAASEAARATFEEADAVLGFALSRLCFEGPEDALTGTANAQPAILTHSIAAYRALPDFGPSPAMAAGHSLGEFTAHVAAGTLSFADALLTVRCRGELMARAGRARSGAMAAVLGIEDDAVDALCRRAAEGGGACVPANYNAPGQVVISGDREAVERAIALARDAGARRAVPLNVSGAFHSPLMEPAVEGLAAQLAAVELRRPAFPVVSNVTAQAVRDPSRVRALLLEQLTAPVRWTACVRTMLDAGIVEFLEVGPGNVLTGLLRRIDREARGRCLGTASELRELSPA